MVPRHEGAKAATDAVLLPTADDRAEAAAEAADPSPPANPAAPIPASPAHPNPAILAPVLTGADGVPAVNANAPPLLATTNFPSSQRFFAADL